MSRWSNLKSVLLPLIAGLLLAQVFGGPLARIDIWWSDVLLRLPRSVPVDERIVIIEIDEKTLDKLEPPTAYWAPYFSQVFAALVRNQASVVGLDYLIVESNIHQDIYQAVEPYYKPKLLGENSVPGRSAWIPMVLAREEQAEKLPAKDRTRFIVGYLPRKGERRTETSTVSRFLMGAVSEEDVDTDRHGFLFLDRDRDQVWRRQFIWPRYLEVEDRLDPENGGDQNGKSFAVRIVEETVGKKLEQPGDKTYSKPIPVGRDEHLRINFIPPRAGEEKKCPFKTYPFWEVVTRRDDPAFMGQFKGKVVLVGTVAAEQQDIASTSVGEISGLYAQGMLVNTLLTENYIRELGGYQQQIGLLLVCALSLLVAHVGTFGVSLTLQCLLSAGLAGLSVLCFLQFNLIVPVFSWAFAGLVSWLGLAAHRARTRARELTHVRSLFGRYVSPQVMETILKDSRQATLGAIGKRKITVLFTDINGFSTECERRTAAEIMDMLNAYFQEMNDIIFRNEGTIKQFVGDEIMAMYGAPTPHPEPEIAAVRTAVMMLKRLRELHSRDPGRKRGFYDVKIGIHAGPVILGNVGSASRTEYAAVGDDVNLGSRIMGMCKALESKVLVSKEIVEKCLNLPEVRFVSKGSHAIKGRKEMVELFAMEVVGLETDEIHSLDSE